MIKSIFGKNYKFHMCEGFNNILSESTELYLDGDASAIDVNVHITNEPIKKKPQSRNPSLHSLYNAGLHTKLGVFDILWLFSKDGTLDVTLSYIKAKGLKSIIKKYRHMECPTEVEAFEQVLHELVLVPSSYFFNDLMPVHSSTVSVNGKTIMFAGTGGVGKSSAMLAVKDFAGGTFIADDITVVNADGLVFGNMAWPKIYGYNCAGTNIADLILNGRSLLDKTQFKFKNWRNPSAVRRKIKPNILYPNVMSSSSKVDEIYYLFKEDVKEIIISDLEVSHTKKMTISVIESEYSIFHNHLHWHEYNTIGIKSAPLISMSTVKNNWGSVLDGFLPNAKLKKISIPLDISHSEYLAFIQNLLSKI